MTEYDDFVKSIADEVKQVLSKCADQNMVRDVLQEISNAE